MNTDRNLLFGLLAFQDGAIDADRLSETCAEATSDHTVSIAERLVDRGCLTLEQRARLERKVEKVLEANGGDIQATLAASIDGRFLDALKQAGPKSGPPSDLGLPAAPAGHVLISSLGGDEKDRNRYTLTHLHAKGGMGQVWKARDASLGREIALKELRPDQSDNSIVWSRFLYEARITAQLEHPGIVPVYELGEGDSPYYTMRFVKGRTLSEATRNYHKDRAAGTADRVGLVNLLGAFVAVCNAMAYAHSRGIIHRDLKGQNVVLGDFGEVIVLDWGLAKRVGAAGDEASVADALGDGPGIGAGAGQDAGEGPDATVDGAFQATLAAAGENGDDATLPPGQSARAGSRSGSNGKMSSYGAGYRESGAGPEGTMQGQLLGTPAYMAPEQAEGRHDLVDFRTDVYGLGAILYEILTGQPPFTAKKTTEVLRMVCKEPPTAPRQINTAVPPDLEAICLKAMSKASADRYDSATELAREVQRHLADEPVAAFPEPLIRRVARWARRHRTGVAAAAALLVTSTVALSISTILVAEQRNEAKAQGGQARQAIDLLTRVAEVGFEDRVDPLQKDLLEKALAYYENFTRQAAGDPEVRLEHGRAFERMADIQRKLGQLKESEASFRRSLAILEPDAERAPAVSPVRRALALSRSRLADLHLRRNVLDQADPLISAAIDAQKTLADANAGGNPQSAEDRWQLGRSLKCRGDLLKRRGKFAQARSAFLEATTALDTAAKASPADTEIRNDLALALDALAWLEQELGDGDASRRDYQKALDILNPLVAEFPTLPRFRESLARACNGLARLLLEQGGEADKIEGLFRRELELTERLTQDFPDRPEYRRELARTCTNLGYLLTRKGAAQEAEAMLRRAIAVNTELRAKFPADVQFRLDLSKCQQNLAALLLLRGQSEMAADLLGQAIALSGPLVKEFPDTPRYREAHAQNLGGLADAISGVDPARAEATFAEARSILQTLVEKHPENAEYQLELVKCLNGIHAMLAAQSRNKEIEPVLRKALAILDGRDDAQAKAADWRREQAAILTNLASLGGPDAERDHRRAIAIGRALVDQRPALATDRQNLALFQNNLASALADAPARAAEALALFGEAAAGCEALMTDAPKEAEPRSYLGLILEQKGRLLARTAGPEKGRPVLARAVDEQRQAVKLGGNLALYRTRLGEHLTALAETDLTLGAHAEAAAAALELPKVLTGSRRARACLDAALILARCVTKSGDDARLTPADRTEQSSRYLARTVVLLREAVDTDPKLAAEIKASKVLDPLRSRPEFRTMLSTLVESAQ